MIKRIELRTIIIAAALVVYLSVSRSGIHAEPSAVDSVIDAGIKVAAPLISSGSRENPNGQYSGLLPADLPEDPTEEMTDSEKESLAKDRLFQSALQMAENTEFGDKIRQIENAVSDFIKFEYFKSFNGEKGLETENKEDPAEKGYGVSFSPKLDGISSDNLGVKADFTYADTIVFTEYEIQDNMIAVEFSNGDLNRRLDATASFGIAESDSESAFVFKLSFEFD